MLYSLLQWYAYIAATLDFRLDNAQWFKAIKFVLLSIVETTKTNCYWNFIYFIYRKEICQRKLTRKLVSVTFLTTNCTNISSCSVNNTTANSLNYKKNSNNWNLRNHLSRYVNKLFLIIHIRWSRRMMKLPRVFTIASIYSYEISSPPPFFLCCIVRFNCTVGIL